MSKQHVKIIDGTVQLKSLLDWVFRGVSRGLEISAVRVTIELEEENRTLLQNSKQWPMLADISNQLTWHGEKLTPEDWKILLCNEFRPQKLVPGISGGFVALNFRTSKASKEEMCDVIEIYYAYGAQNKVVWSEKSLKQYESYKQAQQ